MAKTNGAQTVQTIPGRNIIFSAGVGRTNIDELKWLADTVLSDSAAWKHKGWAYIADCSSMHPVTPSESDQLVIMTRQFVKAGCKAFAFVEGTSIMLRVQAQKHTERSETGVTEGHFATLDEALTWLKSEVGI